MPKDLTASLICTLIMECLDINWLCKHTRKVRSSQVAICCTELSKIQLFSVSIVKCFHSFFFLFKEYTRNCYLYFFSDFRTCLRLNQLNQTQSWSVTRKVLLESKKFFLSGTWLLKIIWVSGIVVWQFCYMN